MKKLVISTAVFAALSITTAAQAYQFEVNGNASYAHLEENSSNDNNEAAAVGGNVKIYLAPVSTNKGPLAEAAFTSMASSVYGGYDYVETDSSNDIKLHAFNAGGEFFIPTSLVNKVAPLNVPLYAAGSVYRPKIESLGSNAYTYEAKVGFLPVPNLLLAAGVAGLANSDDDETNALISGKILSKVGANDLNLQADIILGHDHDAVRMAADYYIDRTLSVGTGYAMVNNEVAKDPYAFNVNARKFLADNFSVQGKVSFGKGYADINGNQANLLAGTGDDKTVAVTVGGTYRF